MQEYLAAAAEYFLNSNGTKSVDEIEGIWLASDDSGVVDEVRTLCPKYFPNVRDPENIIWVSAYAGVATYSNRQVLLRSVCLVHTLPSSGVLLLKLFSV